MPRYVYICSAGHSGSTLLDMLLGTHSRVESLGEITQLPKNLALNTRCTCGELVRACQVWVQVLQALSNEVGVDLFANPYSLNLGYIGARVIVDGSHQTMPYRVAWKALLGLRYMEMRFGTNAALSRVTPFEQAIQNNFRLYDTVREITGMSTVVDSSKSYLKGASIYLKDPAEARILLLIRDGRGVFYSGRKRGLSRAQSLIGWRTYYSRAMPIIRRWVLPEHMLRVAYEDLASNPKSEMERVCDFLGLDFQESMLNFSRKTHHNTNGNDMRFGSSEIKVDRSWQQHLTSDDLLYFDRKAGDLNRALGY